MKHCAYSGEPLDENEGTLVGTVDRTSGPSAPVYACTTCVAVLDLLPLDDHPEGSTGRPRRRDGQPVLATGPAPVRIVYGERAS